MLWISITCIEDIFLSVNTLDPSKNVLSSFCNMGLKKTNESSLFMVILVAHIDLIEVPYIDFH
jgi:hypothetical protein